MSDLLDVQVQLYPEILRKMAAGEKLASTNSEEQEKLAAAMLVVDTLENEKKAEAKPAQEKKAVEIGLATLGLLGLAAPKIKDLFQKMRGDVVVPEAADDLIKSFKKIMEERARSESMKRMAIGAGIGGAALGALAVKALDRKSDEKSSSEKLGPVVEKKAEGVTPDEASAAQVVGETKSEAPGSPNARALLDKVLKNLQ